MPELGFELIRDPRGSQMHVRRRLGPLACPARTALGRGDRRSGECVGCAEVGLFELLKALIVDEERRRARGGGGAVRCG